MTSLMNYSLFVILNIIVILMLDNMFDINLQYKVVTIQNKCIPIITKSVHQNLSTKPIISSYYDLSINLI